MEGVYVVDSETKEGAFQSIEAATLQDLKKLLHKISERVVCLLEREGLLERDMEQSYLTVAGPNLHSERSEGSSVLIHQL